MSVNIRIPSRNGDEQICVQVPKAEQIIHDMCHDNQNFAVINGIVDDSCNVHDGDDVMILPRIAGG